MLETLLERLLQKVIGKYVEEIDRKTLSLSVSHNSHSLSFILDIQWRCLTREFTAQEDDLQRFEVATKFGVWQNRKTQNENTVGIACLQPLRALSRRGLHRCEPERQGALGHRARHTTQLL